MIRKPLYENIHIRLQKQDAANMHHHDRLLTFPYPEEYCENVIDVFTQFLSLIIHTIFLPNEVSQREKV